MATDDGHQKLRWLRKVNIYVWATSREFLALVRYLSRLRSSTTFEARSERTAELVRNFLEVGDALLEQPARGYFGSWRRAARLHIRAFYLSRMVVSTIMVARESSTSLRSSELQKIIHFGETALKFEEQASERLFGVPSRGLRAALMPNWQKVRGQRAARRWEVGLHSMLGATYLRLNIGDIAQNLDRSSFHYREAARLLEDKDSFGAARLWLALGEAFLEYPTESRDRYALKAVDALERALDVLARQEGMPTWVSQRWVTAAAVASVLRRPRATSFHGRAVAATFGPLCKMRVLGELGRAYLGLKDYAKAYEYLDRALQETPDVPHDHIRARVELQKGFTYLESPLGDRQKNLSIAAQSFGKALPGLKKGVFLKPYVLCLLGDARVCILQDSLGMLKFERRGKIFEMIVRNLREVAKIARQAGMDTVLPESLFLLGQAYHAQNNVPKAFRALVVASRVSDRLHRRARTPRLRHYWAYREASLYELLVQVSWRYYQLLKKLNMHKKLVGAAIFNSGLSFAEKGRTLFLQSELANREFLPRGATREELNEFFALRQRWHEAELRFLERESSADLGPVEEQGKIFDALRERRDVVEKQYLAALDAIREKFQDPSFDPDRPFLPIRSREIQSLARKLSMQDTTALVEYYFAGRYLMTFVIFPNTGYWARTAVPVEEFGGLTAHWQHGLKVSKFNPTHWEKGYLGRILNGISKLAWYPAETIGRWEEEYGRKVKRVIVIPHRFLQLIPLHAVRLRDGTVWGDNVNIQYAPSASVLARVGRVRDAVENQTKPKAVVVSYAPSDEPLPFNAAEARAIARELDAVMLTGREATKANLIAAVENAAYIHLSSHGTFDPNAPLDSSLKLAPQAGNGHDRLTLGEIFGALRLPKTGLVILSACETGLSKIEPFHEECIGFPAGFLYSGAPTVISSLWAVSDLATWLLMGMFSHHLAIGTAPFTALARAQSEFRTLTKDEVLTRVRAAASAESDPNVAGQMLRQGELVVRSAQSTNPFDTPYWWAGFTVNGIG
jgi:CHAT domain-containing protein/tetratricopeptide (TPR) repeat protein